MKKNLTTKICFIALFIIAAVSWSCTKQNESAPSAQTTVAPEDILQAGEFLSAQVVPGVYSILKFIDSGDDQTSDFTGYTFEFKSDGTLVATTNTIAVFTGKWKLNSAQTMMTINITGNAKLKNLSDDSWKVVAITNHRISLKKAGPDKVIFVM